MNTRARVMTIAAAVGISLSLGLPAQAASVMTEAFVANIRPNVDFLDRASRLALDNSSSPRVRSFAHDEAVEQTITANSIVAWSQTSTVAGAADAIGVVDPTFATAPLDSAAAVAAEVVTGRSVAVDQRPLTVTPAARPPVLPAGAEDLARLEKLNGRAFDALYRTTQHDALQQLAMLYSDYIARGDDAGLRALSIRELPKINRRLAELRRL